MDTPRTGNVLLAVLAAGLLAGLVAAAGLGRARRSGLRSAAFLFSAVAVAVLLAPVAVNEFVWRYQLPQLVLLAPAAAIAVTALTRPKDKSGAPAADTSPDGHAAPPSPDG